MYEQIYTLCQNIEEVMQVFSRELQEIQKDLDEKKRDLNEVQKDLDKKKKDLDEKINIRTGDSLCSIQ